jgi:hypothetical protein
LKTYFNPIINSEKNMTFLRNLASATGGVAITAATILFFILAISLLVLTSLVPLAVLADLSGG